MDRAFPLATSLLARDDVTGVLQSSLRLKDGRWSPENCISVGVFRKRPLSELTPGQMIPTEIAGVKTDVIELRPRLSMYSPTYTVIGGGMSIGREVDENSGTLGGVLLDTVNNTLCGITNYHVLAAGDTPQIPVPYVIHPSGDDGGLMTPSGRVGKTTRFTIDEWGDAAIFTLTKPSTLSMLDTHQILRGVSIPELGELVEKVGRTTGATQGTVSALGYLSMDYSAQGYGTISMYFMAYVPRDDPNELIVDEGDSGSVIYSSTTGNGLGLHVAHVTSPVTIGFANILSYVLEELQCDCLLTNAYSLQRTGSFNLVQPAEISRTGTLGIVMKENALTAKLFAINDHETIFATFESWVQSLGYTDTAAFLTEQAYETVEDYVASWKVYDTLEDFLDAQTVKSLKSILADNGVTF